jgi:hypothetical protein
LLVVGASTLPSQIAVGPEFARRCVDLATVRAATTGQNSKLIELTPDQWQFLRGIYAMNPKASTGLPDGDKAVLGLGSGDSSGLLFFVDGDKACAPMNAPRPVLLLMEQVAVGDANHQSAGLQASLAQLTNGCAWNAMSAFAKCGRAVAHVRGSYAPISDVDHGWRLSQRGL